MYDDTDYLTLDSFLSDYGERDWVKQAACRGMDPNLFFPERGDWLAVKKVKEICGKCPVRSQCREYGDKERFGFWGGEGYDVRCRKNGRRKTV